MAAPSTTSFSKPFRQDRHHLASSPSSSGIPSAGLPDGSVRASSIIAGRVSKSFSQRGHQSPSPPGRPGKAYVPGDILDWNEGVPSELPMPPTPGGHSNAGSPRGHSHARNPAAPNLQNTDDVPESVSDAAYSTFDEVLSDPYPNITDLAETTSQLNLANHYLEKTRRLPLPRMRPLRRPRTKWRDSSVKLLMAAIRQHEKFDSSFGKMQAWLQQHEGTHAVDKLRLANYPTAVKDKAVNMKKTFLLEDKNLPRGFDIINLPESIMHFLVARGKNPDRRERHNGKKEARPSRTAVDKNDYERYSELVRQESSTCDIVPRHQYRRYRDFFP